METLGPLVPYLLGLALTATLVVLLVGIFSFAFNSEFHRKHGNTMMRARVIVQGIAIALFALLVFVFGKS
jgi:hypothetical protein